MTSPATLTLVDGVRIVVPDSLDLITPYVLQEQGDWFEDEIKLLRRLLQPGNKVVDIGANYGVYTLSMAKTVGPEGGVWAFEPASATADMLSKSISANGFLQVTLERSALSSASGTAQLSLNTQSELNALVHGEPIETASEIVPLVTLDECAMHYGWHDIAFMKIDAEGEESNILKGGARFFSEMSPLILYEIKVVADLNMGLVQSFAALGYDSYRLVPGLDLLVPFDIEVPPDGYLLNLFACKPERADQLAARGYLLKSAADLVFTGAVQLSSDLEDALISGEYDWRHTLSKMPYGTLLSSYWEQTMAAGNSADVDKALSLYALSRDPSRSSSERFEALKASLDLFAQLCLKEPLYLRLASLARVARDYGARTLAANALIQLNQIIDQSNQVDLSEPFLVPGERFDSLPTGESVGNWVVAAVLEEFERLESYSSFYTGASARQRLETIRALGLGSPEMARRLQLLQRRYGLTVS